jgi:hypothetical protein
MATNAIGEGTENLQLNLVRPEKVLLDGKALNEGLSLGEFIRQMSLEGLKHRYPELAATIGEIRRKHREMVRTAREVRKQQRALAKAVVMAATVWVVWLSFLPADHHGDARARGWRGGRAASAKGVRVRRGIEFEDTPGLEQAEPDAEFEHPVLEEAA